MYVQNGKFVQTLIKIPPQPQNKIRKKNYFEILATSAKNLILLELGMTLAFPTLVIAALLHSDGSLSFTTTEASWFGSILYICQPVGSILSGTVLERLGRKKSMLLVNIPQIIGWSSYYFFPSIPVMFATVSIMGLDVGCMEAPILTYVGEIAEPSVRGILTSYSGSFVPIGFVIEFTLGTKYGWNTAALISAILPIITIIAISQIPESPIWLLTKGRITEAEKALCWLRGWVPLSSIQDEMNQLIRYNNQSYVILSDPKIENNQHAVITKNNNHNNSYENPAFQLSNEFNPLPVYTIIKPTTMNKLNAFDSANDNIIKRNNGKSNIRENIADMIRPAMLRPFTLIITCFLITYGTGFYGMQPYLVEVFRQLQVPTDVHWSTVFTWISCFTGAVCCTITVSYVGKRGQILYSLIICACCNLSLSFFCFKNSRNNEDNSSILSLYNWAPFILYMIYAFSHSFGIGPVPWMMISEIFPTRGRGLASGISAACSYIMAFISSKIFLYSMQAFGLSCLFLIYGSITVIGIVYVYFKLPETEGRTLEDIENTYLQKK